MSVRPTRYGYYTEKSPHHLCSPLDDRGYRDVGIDRVLYRMGRGILYATTLLRIPHGDHRILRLTSSL